MEIINCWLSASEKTDSDEHYGIVLRLVFYNQVNPIRRVALF